MKKPKQLNFAGCSWMNFFADDDAQWKKKKKSKPSAEAFGQVRTNFGLDNSERVKTPTVMVKHTDGLTISDSPMAAKQNADLEVEKLLSKSVSSMKAKATKKIELPVSLLNKKVKIMTEGIKGFKEKKSARESFVCGACGQLGHMRTNKNCPKYGEDPETPSTAVDLEKESSKPSPQDASQSQQKIPPKKLITKSATKAPEAETPEGEISSSKTKFLKVRCTNGDTIPDKVTPVPTLSSEQPSTSDLEAGNKSVPKVIKIVSNKSRPDDAPVESHKLNVVIRPPTETGKEHSHKKITFKQPKEIIDLDQVSPEGVEVEYLKTKKMSELTGYGANGERDGRFLPEDVTRRKKREAKRMWEEEEKRRIPERMREEERVRWIYEEEMRSVEEQDRLAELRRYEEELRREREGEECRKAKKKKKKTKSIELHDYLEDFRSKRTNRSLPDRERTGKRKPIVELGRYGAEYVPPTKRRRGGEVGLANILECIVEALKKNKNISFLFLKPVSKKEAPNYLDIVKRPMDLSTIRDKVRRLEYKDRHEFRDDVWQIAENAHIYNDGRNPGIPPLADQLLEMCDYLLNDFADSLDEAEASIDRE